MSLSDANEPQFELVDEPTSDDTSGREIEEVNEDDNPGDED